MLLLKKKIAKKSEAYRLVAHVNISFRCASDYLCERINSLTLNNARNSKLDKLLQSGKKKLVNDRMKNLSLLQTLSICRCRESLSDGFWVIVFSRRWLIQNPFSTKLRKMDWVLILRMLFWLEASLAAYNIKAPQNLHCVKCKFQKKNHTGKNST